MARHSREDKEEDLSGILEGFPLSVQCRQSQGAWELWLEPCMTADLTCRQHCYWRAESGSHLIITSDFISEKQVRHPNPATYCIHLSVTDLKLIENSSKPKYICSSLWLASPRWEEGWTARLSQVYASIFEKIPPSPLKLHWHSLYSPLNCDELLQFKPHKLRMGDEFTDYIC